MQQNIGILIDKLEKFESLENIIIVDDNSTDGTLEEINEFQKKYNNIILKLRKGKKPGRGVSGIEAYKTYIELNDESELLIEMDADLSHNPEYIPVFLNEFSNGHKIIVGSRYADGGAETGRNIARKILSKFAHFIIRILFSITLKDPTAGFRALDKNILRTLDFSNFISEGPEIVEELYFVLTKKNIAIKEIPIVFPDRNFGESKLNFFKLCNVFYSFFKIILNSSKLNHPRKVMF